MKLDANLLQFILKVIQTAQAADIDSVIIEPGRVRGTTDSRAVVLHTMDNVPDMPFGSIGLSRLSSFTSRLDLAKAGADYTIDILATDSDPMWAKSFVFKNKKLQISHRCANPKTITAPKTISDPEKITIPLTSDNTQMFQQGSNAMKANEVFINGCHDGVYMEFVDNTGDKLTYLITSDVPPGVPIIFTHKYSVKTLIKLLKYCQSSTITITRLGLIKLNTSGLTLYIVPEE